MSLIETPLAGAALHLNNPWTADRIDQLRRLRNDGLSAAQIAAEMGVTRNAVLGKLNRMHVRPVKRHVAMAVIKRVAEAKERPIAELPPEPEFFIPCGQRCSLLDLEPFDEKCRWPIGEPGTPDFFFCGGQTSGYSPYCGYHGRIAYEPRASRQDRRPRA